MGIFLYFLSLLYCFAALTLSVHTEQQVVKIAYTLVFKTAVHHDACRTWRQVNNPTWESFKTHFQASYTDVLEETAMQGNTFGRANMATATEEIINNLTQVSQTTNEDRATVAELIRTNSQLTTQIAQLQSQFCRIFTEVFGHRMLITFFD